MSKKIVNHLLNYAAQNRAGRLVIENAPRSIDCHYHLEGGAKRVFTLPKKLEKTLIESLRQILKIAPGELAANRYCKIQDRRYSLTFYLTILPDKNGEKVIINIINQSPANRGLKKLGLTANDQKTLTESLSKKTGLIIVSAPNGQGKSTTLNAIISTIDLERSNAYFFSARPETRIDGLNYLLPTSANLERVLRQDSNLIVWEDLQDEANLKKILLAAASGRLVLATMAGISVWEIMAKILKSDSPLNLKLDSLKIITNQRLANLKRIPKASSRGVAGAKEIGLFEVLKITPELKHFIKTAAVEKKANNFWEKLAALALKQGFKPLKTDWQKKVAAGIISKD